MPEARQEPGAHARDRRQHRLVGPCIRSVSMSAGAKLFAMTSRFKETPNALIEWIDQGIRQRDHSEFFGPFLTEPPAGEERNPLHLVRERLWRIWQERI